MPNWCYNNLTISGDAGEIAKFNAWLGGEPLTLQKIKPMPSELEDTTSPTPPDQAEKAKELFAKYGAEDWYAWHVQNWGTKWDVDAEFDDASSTDDCLIFNFDSAWSPPTNAIIELSNLFPNLTITLRYREDGCLFAGILRVGNGEHDDIYVDGSKDKEQYRTFIIDEYGDDPFEWEEEQEEEAAEATKPAEAAPAPKKAKKKVKKAVKKPAKKTKAKAKAKAKKKKK